MNTGQKAYQIGCYSIRTLENNHDIIYQESVEIHQHEVPKGYLVLSKNDFGKVKKRINVGIFNKKTNFTIGEKSSLIFWDNQELKLVSLDTSKAIQESDRYFMIYDMNFIADSSNVDISITDKSTNEEIHIVLNKQFGVDIGSFLRMSDPATTIIPDDFKILKALITIENGKLSINKQVLINSNPDFLIGILEGYINNANQFYLKSNINTYNFTYILNLLGAQYSIRSLENKEKHIRFKLPIFLKAISDLPAVYSRSYKYFFNPDEDTPGLQKLKLCKDIASLVPNITEPDFYEMVNAGLIEMISLKDLVFLELEENTTMYDLTMPNANATNYSLPGMPLAKNSDGDILGAFAIMTKDAAEECTRKFSTELKENFLNLANGQVNNWGVKLDSQLGLYTGTK